MELSGKLTFYILKLVVYSEKNPNFFERRCPNVTVPVSSLNFELMILVSIFFLLSTEFFVRKMTLAFLIAVDTEESTAVGAFSKHK